MAELPKDMIFHYHSDDGITIKVDAIPLVHCKDCKWFDRTEPKQCRQHGICNIHDDFFCADGERRDPCSSQDS